MGSIVDVVVVGSGIAGLSLALKVAKGGASVMLITKKTQAESNTNYAQGGIACVMAPVDAFASHIEDTLRAGDGLCDLAVVSAIIEEGPGRVQELAEMGVSFSQEKSGSWDLGQEGGHTHRRILHVKDMTGRAIEEALLNAIAAHPNITLREHVLAIDLITASKLARRQKQAAAKDNVVGLYALRVHTGKVETITASAVVLATGGSGQAYLYTTNPDIATGDGVAMAARAGVPVRGMEFVQFHPTALYTLTGERFLISEAVRGEGAILRNTAGAAFMEAYHPQGDLAPRDTVARAIDSEMKESGSPHVWLDLTHKPEAFIRERFPTIWQACERHGINPAKDYIPVVPAAHYQCGGVETNIDAETALPGLYACGEVASTGLHGGNRLASNSLLEAVVVAHRGAASILNYLNHVKPVKASTPLWVDGEAQDSDERVVLSHNWEELRRVMWNYVGIVRTQKRLERAKTRLAMLQQEINDYYWNFKVEPELIELRNLILVSSLIVEAALARKESCGLHYIV